MEMVGHSVRASIDFNGPLNALATAPNKKLIAVGGRDVLKIVALEATGFSERRNLRAGKSNLNFSTNDIRWHPQSDSLLATAATNGAVVIWNLQRDGFKHVQERVLSGHRRAVNRICWHPTDGTLLLSGSQDGTIKLWDTRGKVSNTYQPKSESVRDVRMSAFQPNRFAAAFENGIVQIWDIRKNTQPELKFQAHKGLVLALDWHSGKPNVLASGGRDRYVKIWDLGDVSKPRQTIQTIASVGRVAWRPSNADHIATSASLTDNRIHVWDVQHPWIPIASMKGHTDVASGIEWMDTPASATFGQPSDVTNGSAGTEWEGLDYWQHMLACSKDGTLRLHSLADAFKPHQSLPTTALALNSRGQVAFSHDYIDRTCASLKIHRHTNLVSSLFTVTDATTTVQKFTDSPYSSSFNADTTDDEAFGGASAQRMANRQVSGGSVTGGNGGALQPPPFAPRTGSSLHLHQSHPSNGNLNASGGGGGIMRHGPHFPHTQSMQSMSMQSIEGSGVDATGRRFVYPSGTSSAASSTTSSPVQSFFGSAAAPTPRAVVALVSMQNVNKADELEEIFHGDDSAFWAAQDRLELMQQHFEHVALLKDAFGFDEEVFRFLATHYVFVDDQLGFSDMCAHNALAAFVTGNTHLSQMWRILDVLYMGTKTGSSGTSNASPSNALEEHHAFQRSPETSRAGPLDHRHFSDGNDTHGLHDHHPGHPGHHGHHGHHAHYHPPFANNALEDSQHSRHNFDNDEFSSTTSSMAVMGATQAVVGGNLRGAGTTHTALLLEQLDQVNPQAMQGFDPYPYDIHNAGRTQGVGNALNSTDKENARPGAGAAGGHNSFSSGVQYRSNVAKSSSVILHGSAVHGELSHVRDPMLKDLLEYYVDLGDLQTAVAVAFVTSKTANVEDIVGKSWLQQIYMHYIELLHQLRMYQVANELILHCSDASIRQMNQRSTTVYFNCANCSKPCETMLSTDGEPVNPYLCTNCNNPTTRCSICQLPVRGLYVWCPVCSHGGHLEHLADWFRDEEACPTGCSHRCSFNFSDVRSIWSN